MRDILTALVDLMGLQSLAIQAVADHVSALKKTLVFHYPEIDDDLKSQIATEQRESAITVRDLQKKLALLREAVSELSN
jgi:hypothetical protein